MPARIAIEVDGQQHFKGSMHGDSQQRERDVEKNKKYWGDGWGVVRVHYQHAASVAAMLLVALEERRKHPKKAFIMFCGPYGQPWLFQSRGDIF